MGQDEGEDGGGGDGAGAGGDGAMRIEVLLPSRILAADEVASIVAEGHEGAFGILEHHIDYVSPLVPGILTYRRKADGMERIFAVDEGTDPTLDTLQPRPTPRLAPGT